MGWQADAVRLAVEPIGFGAVPIHRCLCFTNAEWGLRSALFVIDDVRIGWATALVEAIQSTPVLDAAAVATLSHHLSSWFPASRLTVARPVAEGAAAHRCATFAPVVRPHAWGRWTHEREPDSKWWSVSRHVRRRPSVRRLGHAFSTQDERRRGAR